jgi:hypothetical protein
VESTAATMEASTAAAMKSTAPAAMATSAAVSTGCERRLRYADQNNRCNQNTKNSQQPGFSHNHSFAPPHF